MYINPRTLLYTCLKRCPWKRKAQPPLDEAYTDRMAKRQLVKPCLGSWGRRDLCTSWSSCHLQVPCAKPNPTPPSGPSSLFPLLVHRFTPGLLFSLSPFPLLSPVWLIPSSISSAINLTVWYHHRDRLSQCVKEKGWEVRTACWPRVLLEPGGEPRARGCDTPACHQLSCVRAA